MTTYVLDVATPLTMVLAETTGTDTITCLHGLDLIAQSDGTQAEYFTYDALGSVRQVLDAAGSPLLAQTYDPYGAVYDSVGAGTSRYGWTGEPVDSSGFVFLRARYYSPAQGRFLQLDPSRNEPNPYQYAASNPVMYTDPSGSYWWGPGEALWEASEMHERSQNIHVRIQALMMIGRPEQIHAEYVIPGTNWPVDLLDSITGEVWEIKPWDSSGDAVPALNVRLTALNNSNGVVGLLKGMNPVGMLYDWNWAPVQWIEGFNFPQTDVYIGTDESGWFDIYATQTQPGVILWWKYQRNQRVRDLPPYPIVLPENMKWSDRNRRPNWNPSPGLRPAPGYAINLPNIDLVTLGIVGVCTLTTVAILIDPVPGDEALIPLIWSAAAIR